MVQRNGRACKREISCKCDNCVGRIGFYLLTVFIESHHDYGNVIDSFFLLLIPQPSRMLYNSFGDKLRFMMPSIMHKVHDFLVRHNGPQAVGRDHGEHIFVRHVVNRKVWYRRYDARKDGVSEDARERQAW